MHNNSDLKDLSFCGYTGKKPHLSGICVSEGARVNHHAAAIDGVHIIPPSASVKNSRIEAAMDLFTDEELRYDPYSIYSILYGTKHIGGMDADGLKYTLDEITINDLSIELPFPMRHL